MKTIRLDIMILLTGWALILSGAWRLSHIAAQLLLGAVLIALGIAAAPKKGQQ